MKKLFLVFVLVTYSQTFAQLDVSTGMGINFSNSSSITDYLNINFNSGNSELKSFATQVEFYGEVLYPITDKIQVGIDYGVSLFSFNNEAAFNYELSYYVYKPSIIAYYLISGNDYKFKFGGGAGLRLINLEERIFSRKDYSGNGFGILLRTEGHTRLGSNLFAMIAADVRYDIIDGVSSNNVYLLRTAPSNSGNDSGSRVNFNSFSVGLKLGVSYFF